MQRASIAVALAASLALAQCATPGQTPPTVQQLEQQTAQFISDVQQGVAVACHVVPTVAAILGVFNILVGATVSGVITAICAAVPPPASARYGAISRYGVGPASYIGTTTVTTRNGPSTVVVTGWRTQ